MARGRNAPDTDAKALAERLRDTREYLGLSQQFVADQTKIARSAISDIERGARRVESTELKRLSQLYRYPVEYFLGSASTESDSADVDTIQALARAAGELTPEDREQVLKFADFLRHYRNPPDAK